MNFGMDYSVPGVLGGLGQGYSNPNIMYFGSVYQPQQSESLEGIERFKKTIGELLYGVLFTVKGDKDFSDVNTLRKAIRHFVDIPANILVLAQLLGIEISHIVGTDIKDIYVKIINNLESTMMNIGKFGRRKVSKRKVSKRKVSKRKAY